MTAPFVEPLKQVCEHLDRLGIAYFVGGSVASTMHGEIRTTQDVDLVVELRRDQVGELVRSLEGDFFADVEALMFAVENHSSCNIIHRTTAFKVDLFLRRDRPFSECEMARRVYVAIGGLRLPMATAEDCVLTKLEWFEKGGASRIGSGETSWV